MILACAAELADHTRHQDIMERVGHTPAYGAHAALVHLGVSGAGSSPALQSPRSEGTGRRGPASRPYFWREPGELESRGGCSRRSLNRLSNDLSADAVSDEGRGPIRDTAVRSGSSAAGVFPRARAVGRR